MTLNAESKEKEKNELRGWCRVQRASFTAAERSAIDTGILKNLTDMQMYRASPLLLTYVSVDQEIDTRAIIRTALLEKKDVAVPRCGPNHTLSFYRIRSLEALLPGSFGLLEPEPEPDTLVRQQEGFCILPGLSFDRFGNRLGYGGGYYDRFLSHFSGITIGLCASLLLMKDPLPVLAHDRPVDYVVTEKEVLKVAGNL